MFCLYLGFPGGSVGAGDPGDASSIPGWEDPLEESMATHSNILAWRIPWTEEPDGPESTALQRVGHDRSNWAHGHTLLVFDRSDLLSCTKGHSITPNHSIYYVTSTSGMTSHPLYQIAPTVSLSSQPLH